MACENELPYVCRFPLVCVAGSCACEGNFIGEFCETECGCNGHGNQTNITAAREAGACSAGSCDCAGNWAGEFCEG